MGTTLTALNAGSISYKIVVAIEGYDRLLTTASPAAAVTAWSGTDWSQALGGLFVEMDNSGTAHPWEPFQGGGTCMLRVMDADGTDRFGIDTHRKLSGAETYLAATADRNDTTITVKDTTAFASSGEAFIGTECFAYSGKTGTSFTGCTRGKYAPFTTDGAAARWSGHHRQGLAANRVSLDPIVSAQSRTWLGKWVAVYLHRDVGGVLDVQAQAHLVYAGKIVEIDDAPNGFTVVQLKHVMDTLGEALLGRDQWTANVIDGAYLKTGQRIGMFDFTSFPSTKKTADDLVCVASGATGTNQFNEGYYSLAQICNVMNIWFEGERLANRIFGTYTIAAPVTAGDKGLRSKVYYKIPNAGSTIVDWTIEMPAILAILFGFKQENPQNQASGVTQISAPAARLSNTSYLFQSAGPPLRSILTHIETGSTELDLRMGITEEVGTFFDQYDLLPRGNKPVSDLGLEWGLFSFLESNYVIAAKDGAELRYIVPAFGLTLPGSLGVLMWTGNPLSSLTVSIDNPNPVVVKQVIALDTTFGNLIKSLFYSTGTPGFNHASLDTLSYGLGLNIPGSLLGATFEASVDAMHGANANILLMIEKPMKLAEVIASDLILRWAFPRWKQGIISFASWSLETSATAPVLTENTRARPADTITNDRSATKTSEEWLRDIITIRYNRDQVGTEKYLSYLTFEDATHVDDAGGEGRTLTISARNTYGQLVNTGQGLEQIAPNFMTHATLFTRPLRKQTVSISPALYEQLAIGDVVTMFDEFARDPATGIRGIVALPALVIRTRYNRGGAQSGNPRGAPAQGEIDIMYAPDGARPGAYSPAALLDETVSGGGFTAGYNNGTLTLRCQTHGHSESSEARDASRFASGDKIVIIERDPANPASPTMWSRTIASTPVNDDIVLTAALSAPAFDANLRYRIIYDTFSVQQDAQKAFASQADATDALIENLLSPYQYTEKRSAAPFTDYDPTIPAELVPDACYGDGKPLDCGHEFALAHLGHLLQDYRTARRLPIVFDVPITETGFIGFQVWAIWPVHLGYDPMFSFNQRVISVAPMFRSTTGANVSVRISLLREIPDDGADIADELVAVVKPVRTTETTFATTSTTFAIPAAQFVIDVKDNAGVAWLFLEATADAEVYGLAQFDEGVRQ